MLTSIPTFCPVIIIIARKAGCCPGTAETEFVRYSKRESCLCAGLESRTGGGRATPVDERCALRRVIVGRTGFIYYFGSAKKFSAKRVETQSTQEAWWPRLHSFAIGLEGAPDLLAARKVADHIGTVHHEIHYTVQEGIDALRDVIYHIETYDVTTIRASTPMFLLARVIKSMGIKMVLSGEGADEVFGGYLYFHKAPDACAFHEETIRKISKLHLYDCLRANKSLAAWGVEGRVPFLDKEFLDLAMTINPQAKMAPGNVIEKKILREAFADMLPPEIAWRQKEQFSDGVGYSWIDSLKALTASKVSDRDMEAVEERFPLNTPKSKEEYYYRSLFEEFFPGRCAALTVPSVPSVACSSAEALAWDPAFRNMNDPSGRAVKGVHQDSYSQ